MASAHNSLYSLLREANYDTALDLVDSWEVPRTLKIAGLDDRLRLAGMISDVLDYGGRYGEARQVIEAAGKEAKQRLSGMGEREKLDFDGEQQCWALKMWGMCLYRGGSDHYSEAMECFKLAQRRLFNLRDSSGSRTAESRAWYGIGLVERQRHDYRAGRAAFTRSVELAGLGVDARRKANASTASFDYGMARCYGLGIGWIAYDEALLSEAKSSLVIARRLLLGKRARYITAYVDLVHACVNMSADSRFLDSIDAAIEMLVKAHGVLAPENGPGHPTYALRAANELAYAHLRRAHRIPQEEKEAEFEKAKKLIDKVKATQGCDKRTFSTALLIESRLHRGRNQNALALARAQEAKDKAGGMHFSRIDSCIGVGEAAYAQGKYGLAADAFREALSVGFHSRKIASVCHLHLSRTYIADDQPSKAFDHFSQWQSIGLGLENAFIADLAELVREKMKPLLEDFRIPRDIETLNPVPHELDLHRWLAQKAMERAHGDRSQARALLGVSERTLGTYLHGGKERAAKAGE